MWSQSLVMTKKRDSKSSPGIFYQTCETVFSHSGDCEQTSLTMFAKIKNPYATRNINAQNYSFKATKRSEATNFEYTI